MAFFDKTCLADNIADAHAEMQYLQLLPYVRKLQ